VRVYVGMYIYNVFMCVTVIHVISPCHPVSVRMLIDVFRVCVSACLFVTVIHVISLCQCVFVRMYRRLSLQFLFKMK